MVEKYLVIMFWCGSRMGCEKNNWIWDGGSGEVVKVWKGSRVGFKPIKIGERGKEGTCILRRQCRMPTAKNSLNKKSMFSINRNHNQSIYNIKIMDNS